jgi:hypothetical protein
MPPLEWGLQAVTMQQKAPAETRRPQREAWITGEERSGNTHQKVTPRRCGSGAFLCAPGFPGTGNGADSSILQWAQKGGDEGLHLGVVRCPLPEPAGPSRPPCPIPPKMSCRGGLQSVQAPGSVLKCQTDRPEPVAPLLPPSGAVSIHRRTSRVGRRLGSVQATVPHWRRKLTVQSIESIP